MIWRYHKMCVCGLLVESLLLGDGFDSKERNDSRLFRVFRMVSQKEERKSQVNVCMSECLSSHQYMNDACWRKQTDLRNEQNPHHSLDSRAPKQRTFKSRFDMIY